MVRAVVYFLFASLALGQVHEIPVQAQWFPSDRAELESALGRSFAAAGRHLNGAPPRKGLLALVVPHAGIVYSGHVAATAISRLGQPPAVIILGFSHRRRTEGVLAPVLDSYQTPLGRVEVDQAALRSLGFARVPEATVCDHSVENQIPFIQHAAPDSKVIPLYVGDMPQAQLSSAAARLAARLKAGDVIVASSDFTHHGAAYGYTPFATDERLSQRLRARFVNVVEEIGTLVPARFDSYLARTGDTTCGQAPIRLLMATLARWKEDVFTTPLAYANSGDMTRDWSAAVSYGAVAFYPYSSYSAGANAEKLLLASARATIDSYLSTGRKAAVPVPETDRTPELRQPGAVFVTIKKNGRLRGCVGEFAPRLPLAEAVADRALAAATQDPRFPPLEASEGLVTLDISVLTPLRRVASWRDVKLGQGVVLELNGRSSTFLPEIAGEMGWTRSKMLEELSEKAGLKRDAYRDPQARIYVYSTHKFGESREQASGRQNGASGRPLGASYE